jgi:hypothetical protein
MIWVDQPQKARLAANGVSNIRYTRLRTGGENRRAEPVYGYGPAAGYQPLISPQMVHTLGR